VSTETGKKHSKDPITIEKAKAQMRVLVDALSKGGARVNPREEEVPTEESPRAKARPYGERVNPREHSVPAKESPRAEAPPYKVGRRPASDRSSSKLVSDDDVLNMMRRAMRGEMTEEDKSVLAFLRGNHLGRYVRLMSILNEQIRRGGAEELSGGDLPNLPPIPPNLVEVFSAIQNIIRLRSHREEDAGNLALGIVLREVYYTLNRAVHDAGGRGQDARHRTTLRMDVRKYLGAIERQNWQGIRLRGPVDLNYELTTYANDGILQKTPRGLVFVGTYPPERTGEDRWVQNRINNDIDRILAHNNGGRVGPQIPQRPWSTIHHYIRVELDDFMNDPARNHHMRRLWDDAHDWVESLGRVVEGAGRPATFEYSSPDLTAAQKAKERAAHYRTADYKKPEKKKFDPNPVKTKEQTDAILDKVSNIIKKGKVESFIKGNIAKPLIKARANIQTKKENAKKASELMRVMARSEALSEKRQDEVLGKLSKTFKKGRVQAFVAKAVKSRPDRELKRSKKQQQEQDAELEEREKLKKRAQEILDNPATKSWDKDAALDVLRGVFIVENYKDADIDLFDSMYKEYDVRQNRFRHAGGPWQDLSPHGFDRDWMKSVTRPEFQKVFNKAFNAETSGERQRILDDWEKSEKQRILMKRWEAHRDWMISLLKKPHKQLKDNLKELGIKQNPKTYASLSAFIDEVPYPKHLTGEKLEDAIMGWEYVVEAFLKGQ
tara:strand:+ start:573 stop:2735 length:2163 start_codon:yes stop_codon:yes gene_type:complete